MDFPEKISFTITNVCNLRCKMCGQWGEEGYVAGKFQGHKQKMKLENWKRLVDEIAENKVDSILLRGGEPYDICRWTCRDS